MKSDVLKEMTINWYLVRSDVVRSGIHGFKVGRHRLLQYIDETLNRTEGDEPRNTSLDIAGKLVLFTSLFNDTVFNSGYCYYN